MKAVLISIRQEWCSLIASGQKTIEVRKTKPKLDTPFKVYIYCTKSKKKTRIDWIDKALGGGMVIGEFVCDRIDYTTKDNIKTISEASCVPVADLWEYGRKSSAYGLIGWHISELVIYEKPKELKEFHKVGYTKTKNSVFGWTFEEETSWQVSRPPQSWCYVEEQDEHT